MSQPTQHHIHLVIPRVQAEQWIREQIDAGRQLGTAWFSMADVDRCIQEGSAWLDVVRYILRQMFDKVDIANEWRTATFLLVKSQSNSTVQMVAFLKYRDGYVTQLEGVLKRLKYIKEALPDDTSSEASEPEGARREVFVVHGHDEAAKESVARFLMTLDLQPIILEEEPNAGRTIIEKLEVSFDAGDVGFAVVILTPDDLGAAKDDLGPEKNKADKLKPRARQNVIMELGYAIGLLGRDCVCALYREGVELPSDYHGVVYIPLDKGGAWKSKLANELKAAGIDVDLNKIR